VNAFINKLNCRRGTVRRSLSVVSCCITRTRNRICKGLWPWTSVVFLGHLKRHRAIDRLSVFHVVYRFQDIATYLQNLSGSRDVNIRGSLPSDRWLQVTCGLTTCTTGSAPGPTLANEDGKPLLFYHEKIFGPVFRLNHMHAVHRCLNRSICRLWGWLMWVYGGRDPSR